MFETLTDGLRFPESPRWHVGHLWFAEKRAQRVVRLEADSALTTMVTVPADPGGLGWDPDGNLLVVSMGDRQLLRHRRDTLEVVADLRHLTKVKCNDMVVDARGGAYVGDFGYDLGAGAPPAPGVLVYVDPDGEPAVVATDLGFPNGAVISADGRTLVVAESSASRLTAFTIDDHGGLVDRRLFADLGSSVPDGICLDESGAIWIADPLHNEVVRVAEGGRVLERLSTNEFGAFACVLGGEDGRTLFVCADGEGATAPDNRALGRILSTRVDVPTGFSP